MSGDRIICFGELLLRLSAAGGERLLQSPALDVCVGGAEANVAVCLARLGRRAAMVSIAPDSALGRAARDEVRRHGVDVEGVRLAPNGRMGLYFLTHGAVMRPSEVLYDRRDSAFALAAPQAIDWGPVFADAAWLHVSGVTPAVGANAADAVVRAAKAAVADGVSVSFDGNYRAKMWAEWHGDGRSVLRALFEQASLVFADERDIALVLGRELGGDTPMEKRQRAAVAAFETFPRLQRIASTIRTIHGPDDHTLSGTLFIREKSHTTQAYRLAGIVDRIGGGDAFAAGFLCGLSEGMDDIRALDLAIASACLKHGISGDFNLVNRQDLDVALAGADGDVRR